MTLQRFVLCIAIVLTATGARAQVRDLVERVDAAVLTIHTKEYGHGGVGSAVLVSSDGYALTNAHVVDEAFQIHAVFADGTDYSAKVVDVNFSRDLALIRLSATDLRFAKLGDANALKAGDSVTAIGAPYGLEHSVTRGIVSSAARVFRGQVFIQTDAALHPGNSGGPLFNDQAEVVGINARSDRASGKLAFAIPINAAFKMLRDAGVKVNRPAGDILPQASRFPHSGQPEPRPEAFDVGRWVVAPIVAGAAILLLATLVRKRSRPRNPPKVKIKLGPPKPHEEDDLGITLR